MNRMRITLAEVLSRVPRTQMEIDGALNEGREKVLAEKSGQIRSCVDGHQYKTALHIATESGLADVLINYLGGKVQIGEKNSAKLEEISARELRDPPCEFAERVENVYKIITTNDYDGLEPLIKETIGMCVKDGRFETAVVLADKAGLTQELKLTDMSYVLGQIVANEKQGTLTSMNAAVLFAELRLGGAEGGWVRWEELIKKHDELKALDEEYGVCVEKKDYLKAIALAKKLGFIDFKIKELVNKAFVYIMTKRLYHFTLDGDEEVTDEGEKPYFRAKELYSFGSGLAGIGMRDDAKSFFVSAESEAEKVTMSNMGTDHWRYESFLDIASAQLKAGMRDDAEDAFKLAEEAVRNLHDLASKYSTLMKSINSAGVDYFYIFGKIPKGYIAVAAAYVDASMNKKARGMLKQARQATKTAPDYLQPELYKRIESLEKELKARK